MFCQNTFSVVEKQITENVCIRESTFGNQEQLGTLLHLLTYVPQGESATNINLKKFMIALNFYTLNFVP